MLDHLRMNRTVPGRLLKQLRALGVAADVGRHFLRTCCNGCSRIPAHSLIPAQSPALMLTPSPAPSSLVANLELELEEIASIDVDINPATDFCSHAVSPSRFDGPLRYFDLDVGDVHCQDVATQASLDLEVDIEVQMPHKEDDVARDDEYEVAADMLDAKLIEAPGYAAIIDGSLQVAAREGRDQAKKPHKTVVAELPVEKLFKVAGVVQAQPSGPDDASMLKTMRPGVQVAAALKELKTMQWLLSCSQIAANMVEVPSQMPPGVFQVATVEETRSWFGL